MLLGLSLPHVAISQESETNQQLEEVIIWGTELSSSSLNLKEGSIAIKQADHISDLLRTIPGIDVGGAHSLNQRITIRSMDDKDLRISIDGANQNTYMYHHMGNLQIHADILQSVDIEIGTNSVVNGGLGGAVRFETKTAKQLLRDDEQFGARVQASYGDNSGNSYTLTGFGQLTDTVDILAYYNAVNRANYEVGGGKIKDENGLEIEGTDGKVRGLDGDVNDALVKLGWDISDQQRFEIGYESYQDKGDYSYRPDMGLATDLAITESLGIPLLWPTEFGRDTLTLNYDLDWSEQSSLKVALFQNTSELYRDESGWALNSSFESSAAFVTGEAINMGINILGESNFDNHQLTYGADKIIYDTDYTADYLSGTQDKSSEKAVNSSIFLQDRIQITDSAVVIPGLRYDNYNLDSNVVDNTFDDVTFSLAGEYDLTESLIVKLSTTQLFKGPEIGEVFVGAGLYDSVNNDIKAETGENNELSIAYAKDVLGADEFSLGFTYFDTQIDNYIYDYASSPGGGSWKDNIGDMAIDGFEAYVGYEVGNLKALITFSKAESELNAYTAYAALDGARLDRQQGDTISFNLDYEIPNKQVTLHWDFLSVDDVSAGVDLDGATLDNAKDSYIVHNISARWEPVAVSGLAITAGIDNVLDEFYASQSSRTGVSFHPLFGSLYLQDYEPGRNAKVTVAYNF
jgi:hemoglobin/transferrin/lactoferrin receptor protein